jgi:hypothetical protein
LKGRKKSQEAALDGGELHEPAVLRPVKKGGVHEASPLRCDRQGLRDPALYESELRAP